jgi:hypothetical protein
LNPPGGGISVGGTPPGLNAGAPGLGLNPPGGGIGVGGIPPGLSAGAPGLGLNPPGGGMSAGAPGQGGTPPGLSAGSRGKPPAVSNSGSPPGAGIGSGGTPPGAGIGMGIEDPHAGIDMVPSMTLPEITRLVDVPQVTNPAVEQAQRPEDRLDATADMPLSSPIQSSDLRGPGDTVRPPVFALPNFTTPLSSSQFSRNQPIPPPGMEGSGGRGPLKAPPQATAPASGAATAAPAAAQRMAPGGAVAAPTPATRPPLTSQQAVRPVITEKERRVEERSRALTKSICDGCLGSRLTR